MTGSRNGRRSGPVLTKPATPRRFRCGECSAGGKGGGFFREGSAPVGTLPRVRYTLENDITRRQGLSERSVRPFLTLEVPAGPPIPDAHLKGCGGRGGASALRVGHATDYHARCRAELTDVG